MNPFVKVYPIPKTNMIQNVLESIRMQLNQSLQDAYHISHEVGQERDWVILSNLYDSEGTAFEAARDKLVMMLVNIQHETEIGSFQTGNPYQSINLAPPLYIDLFVLFLANFYDRNYSEGLNVISKTISFFQMNPWFTPESLRHLDPKIDKLVFSMVNLDLADLKNLMDIIGATYLPSVCYKVRLLPFQSDGNPEINDAASAEAIAAPAAVEDTPSDEH
jgi:hypothetical protein